MKKYIVTLDIFTVETVHVEARNKKEAFEKAKNESVYNDGATEFTLYEVVEDK